MCLGLCEGVGVFMSACFLCAFGGRVAACVGAYLWGWVGDELLELLAAVAFIPNCKPLIPLMCTRLPQADRDFATAGEGAQRGLLISGTAVHPRRLPPRLLATHAPNLKVLRHELVYGR